MSGESNKLFLTCQLYWDLKRRNSSANNISTEKDVFYIEVFYHIFVVDKIPLYSFF